MSQYKIEDDSRKLTGKLNQIIFFIYIEGSWGIKVEGSSRNVYGLVMRLEDVGETSHLERSWEKK